MNFLLQANCQRPPPKVMYHSWSFWFKPHRIRAHKFELWFASDIMPHPSCLY